MTDIICPSGLSGRIRGLKVREERILTDRKLAKSGGQVDQLLSACWEETLDHGLYEFEGTTIDWGKVLQGDRFYALLAIRSLTYGPEYTFSVSCAECRTRIEWELNLRDLPVKALSEESRAVLLCSDRFETRLPNANRRVWFRLLTGADERRLPAIRRNSGDHVLSATLAYRILEVEGVDAKDKHRFIEDLSMADVTFLLGEFDRVDFGVETGIDIECQECLAVQRIELPFDRGFFLPRRQPTKPADSCQP